ncbi:alcohol oxidase-like protein [Dentipellis sp. KUC8613]|nr:alcohol oxidase-like protein [Dentipellis sp. KUC8613]
MHHPLKPSVDEEYDIVIAGGGAAGCVLAGRLAAATRSLKILVLEAGPETKDKVIHTQPARYLAHLHPAATTVRFHAEPPTEALAGRSLAVATGQCLGGGSSVNFAVYTRASASDYDAWETTYNNPGWGSKDLIPLLKKVETYQVIPNALNHGYDGPLKVSFGGCFTNVGRQFLEVAPRFDRSRPAGSDTNDLVTLNAWTRYAKWIDSESGKRSDVPHHYIYNQTNPSLHVVTGVHVQRVFIENKRAVGVEFKWNRCFVPDADSAVHIVRAKQLVVVAAGAFGSPGILERSGVGNRDVLEPLGIKTEEHLPGVGENYQDHDIMFPVYKAAPEAETLDAIVKNDPDVIAKLSKQWHKDGSGLLASNGADTAVKIRPSEQELREIGPEFRKVWDKDYAHLPDKPVLLFGAMSLFTGDASNAPARKYFSNALYNLHAVGRGHVHITDAHDATAPLDFKSGFLESMADVEPLVWVYKYAREISRRVSLFRGEYAPMHPKFPPGSQAAVIEDGMPTPLNAPRLVYTAEDDKAIELFVRKNIGSSWHSNGTCAMKAREDGGVVDSKLNVHGVQGLKVADVSICPSNIGANTYSTAVTIGEKAALIIAEELGFDLA